MGHASRRNHKRSLSRTVRSRSGHSRIKPKHILASRKLENIPERGQRERERLRRELEERDQLERELQMIRHRNRMDILFRSTEDITNMISTVKLGNMPVKFFIISAHGTMSRKDVFRMPPHMAAFDLAENEYRGHTTCTSLDQPLLELIIGEDGRSIEGFFNAMLGGRDPPDPLELIPQIAYRTPGQLAYDIRLTIKEEEKDFRDALGCWDVTDAMPTFSPTDFSYSEKGVFIDEEDGTYIDAEGKFMDPAKRRRITYPDAPQYKSEVEIRTKMRRKEGIHLREVLQTLETQYPNTVCFIIVSCCVDLRSPEIPGNEFPPQPSAYTQYALRGRARGAPSSKQTLSMKGRNPGIYSILYEE